MSTLQLKTITCCNAILLEYTVTYQKQNGFKYTLKVCKNCWDKLYPFKEYDTTTKHVKIFQTEVVEIICLSCKSIVTESMGCNTCHPKLEESS